MRKKEFNNEWISQRLGALPSHWDDRSLLYAVNTPTEEQIEELPDEYYEEMLEYCPDNFRRNQGDVGLCVGWDYSFVIETQYTLLANYSPGMKTILVDQNGKVTGFTPDGPFRVSDTDMFKVAILDLSSGWTYHWSRKYSVPPVPEHVEGSTNFGACRALHKKGIALERDVPTDIVAPWDGITYDSEDEQRALTYRIASYHRVDPNPASIKAAMYGLTHTLPYKMPDGSQGKTPLASAFPVYSSFRDSYDDGIVPMPNSTDRLLGGHSSMIIGWKIIDDREYFVNFGSWGTVGDDGLFYIPIEYPFYPNDWWLVSILPEGQEPDPSWLCKVATGFKEWACGR